jgi:hypothetical protein
MDYCNGFLKFRILVQADNQTPYVIAVWARNSLAALMFASKSHAGKLIVVE